MKQNKGCFVGWYEEQDWFEFDRVKIHTIKLKDSKYSTCVRIFDYSNVSGYRAIPSYLMRELLIKDGYNSLLGSEFYILDKDLNEAKKQVENELKRLGYNVLNKDMLCFE